MMDQTTKSILELTQALVRIPSRAGVDSTKPIFDTIRRWLTKHGTDHEMLRDEAGDDVGLHGRIPGKEPGSIYLLDATVDTASYGDEAQWTHPPTAGVVEDGWLYGRGSADSKVGVAISCHILAEMTRQRAKPRIGFGILLDADEHTGGFGGIRSYLDRYPDETVAGVMIGYPGERRIVIGGRGFARFTIEVHGDMVHSGSSSKEGSNALTKATQLATRLTEMHVGDATPDFPLRPKLTVTRISGGGDFSAIPNRAEIDIDVRLTPIFDVDQATRLITKAVRKLDVAFPNDRPGNVVALESSPPYSLPAGSLLATTLQAAVTDILGVTPPLEVVGPSNIGNFLSTLGIEATAGYGVRYEGIHAADERIAVDTILPTYKAYELAIQRLTA